jgi:hypothetical protein
MNKEDMQDINDRNHKRWIGLLTLFIIHFTLFINPVGAQSFTQRLQQNTGRGGVITLHQDAAIDELVNGKTVTPPAPTRPKNNQTTRQQNTTQRTDNQQRADNQQRTDNQQRADNRQQKDEMSTLREQEVATADTIVQPRRTRQMMGYRIQAFAGGKTRNDRQKAEQTKKNLEALFPGQKVYVHFYSPRWICRMGNFRTIAEAKEVLDEVVRMGYDTATLVRGKITVPY